MKIKDDIYKNIKKEIIDCYNNVKKEKTITKIVEEIGLPKSTIEHFVRPSNNEKPAKQLDFYNIIKICKYFKIDYFRYIDMI